VEENALLEVDFSDLCVAHLRPDFVDDIYFPSSEDEYYDDHDDLCDWGNHIIDCICRFRKTKGLCYIVVFLLLHGLYFSSLIVGMKFTGGVERCAQGFGGEA
jgi:hypothetical protein